MHGPKGRADKDDRRGSSQGRRCLSSTRLLPPPQHYYSTFTMGKSDEDVAQEFNELVNMSASELEKWLKVSIGWCMWIDTLSKPNTLDQLHRRKSQRALDGERERRASDIAGGSRQLEQGGRCCPSDVVLAVAVRLSTFSSATQRRTSPSTLM